MSTFPFQPNILLLGEPLTKTAHPGLIVTTRMSYVTTGGPGKEHRANKLPPTRRIREGRKERGGTSPHVLPTSQNPCRWNPSWLRNKLGIRKDPESEWLARDNLETNAIAIKPEAASHAAEQFSWVPLPHSSPLERLFPHVSPRTVHFWVLRKSPLSGPRRDLPSCNIAPKKSVQQARLFVASFSFLHQASHSYLNAFSLCSCLKCVLSLYLPNPTPIWNN